MQEGHYIIILKYCPMFINTNTTIVPSTMVPTASRSIWRYIKKGCQASWQIRIEYGPTGKPKLVLHQVAKLANPVTSFDIDVCALQGLPVSKPFVY